MVIAQNAERYHIEPVPVQDLRTLNTWLKTVGTQHQNMANPRSFARQLAFALCLPQAHIEHVTALLYIPNLIEHGFSLRDLKTFLEDVDYRSLREREALRAPSALGQNLLQALESAHEQIKDAYSEYLAEVIFSNCFRWANTLLDFADAQCINLEHGLELRNASLIQGGPSNALAITDMSLDDPDLDPSDQDWPIILQGQPIGSLTHRNLADDDPQAQLPASMPPQGPDSSDAQKLARIRIAMKQLTQQQRALFDLLRADYFRSRPPLTRIGLIGAFMDYLVEVPFSSIHLYEITPSRVLREISDFLVTSTGLPLYNRNRPRS